MRSKSPSGAISDGGHTNGHTPIRLFYSYSHRDEQYREELSKHLAPLRWNGLVDDWHDRRILAGEDWEKRIAQELADAHLILLFVSSDFLHSRYCYGVEMKRALELRAAGRAEIVPIIVRPCLWQQTPLAALNAKPRDGLAVVKWDPIDDGWVDVAEALLALVRSLSERTGDRDSFAEMTAQARRGWNVPYAAPADFTGREDVLDRIEEGLRESSNVVLLGEGGTGKSTIAVEFAYRNRRVYDVIWWIRGERESTWRTDLVKLARALDVPGARKGGADAALVEVMEWLGSNNGWLLLFDNVADPGGLASFLPAGRGGHVIATSRAGSWGPPFQSLRVGPWSREDSVAYILARCGETDESSARRLAEIYGDLPLALRQATGVITNESESPG